MKPKEPSRYIAAIKPLSGYVALLRDAIANDDRAEIAALLAHYTVCDHGAFRGASAQQTSKGCSAIHGGNTTHKERT